MAMLLAGCAGESGALREQRHAEHKVTVPGTASGASPATFAYRVQDGDTVERIAEEFDTTAMTLRAINGLAPNERLTPGTLLTIADAPPTLLPCGDMLAPLNKEHSIAASCVPDDLIALAETYSYGGEQLLRRDAAVALTSLLANARAAGHSIVARSSYRSYEEQQRTFAYWVQELGLTEAERTSARAGHSEHQLGTTSDVISAATDYELLESFGATPEGRWLADNAPRFGFVLSYPDGAEAITGYAYEPWHIRYVGVPVAQAIAASGLTPHEFLLRRWILGPTAG